MQAVIVTGKSMEEVGNFVTGTKHWFKTTSEYSQRTTSFQKQFQKVTNSVLNESKDK